ncbi:hypothetical protein BS78_01G083500 [Paspalum vaginatum]|nr:hypothetical protein BS78_01G083500 [Paspalum vaginatum]
MDVRVMNSCLVVKWIDRLGGGDDSLVSELLRKKYLGQQSIFQINKKCGPQFWQGLLDVKQWYQIGRDIQVRSGFQKRFWKDTWCGNCTMKTAFPHCYQTCVNPDISVGHIKKDEGWQL